MLKCLVNTINSVPWIHPPRHQLIIKIVLLRLPVFYCVVKCTFRVHFTCKVYLHALGSLDSRHEKVYAQMIRTPLSWELILMLCGRDADMVILSGGRQTACIRSDVVSAALCFDPVCTFNKLRRGILCSSWQIQEELHVSILTYR